MSIRSITATLCTLGFLVAGAQQSASGAGPAGILRYGATTTNLDPDGLSLRFDVLNWSDEAARAAVVTALQSENVQDALDDLPTVGYVWPDGSPVGYAIKYAQTATGDSAERLTFVISRKLGSYDFGGWTVAGAALDADLAYSVIELDVDGSGTASLTAPVDIDTQAGIVRLERNADTVMLFDDVHRLDLGY